MKVSLTDAGVPFVITYRKFLKKPKLERRRRFVGPVQLARNILLKAIEFIDDVAYVTETTTVDPGQSVAVHWAVQIEDPWDVTPGREMGLVAFRMMNDMPPCGAHFEIISPPPKEIPEPSGEFRPEDLQSDKGKIWAGQQGEKFVRPPDAAYAPRPVQPLVEEPLTAPSDTEEEFSDEVPEDLDGAGRLGEDD
jgi:hypothetical protein